VTVAGVVLALVALQRFAELVIAARNTARLRARGAIEVGAGHYPVVVALHATWLATLVVLGWDRPVNWFWLAAFAALQLLRIWVIATLKGRWTTRILVLPGEPLVARGPYRWLRHPNYVVVAGEIAVLPLALGLPLTATLFTLANAIVLAWRIQVEERALAGLR
jgi:methyltransferase